MDILLALSFISQQHIHGVFDGQEYLQRFVSTLEEAANDKNADEHMLRLAQFLGTAATGPVETNQHLRRGGA